MHTSSQYYVYILRCADGTLYTGIATDVLRRFKEHQAGTASKYTRARTAVSVVYTEACASRSDALKRECAIKRMSRTEKERFVTGLCGDN